LVSESAGIRSLRSPIPVAVDTWTESFWHAVGPYTEGAYAGFLDDEGHDRVRATFPPATYARLAEVKQRYDPDNVFRSNANVQPA
jgi:FAD/FMN-containing dehydrogenase